MEEESCFRCRRNEKEVKLLDAIYENEMVKICERCAIIEDIPVIRRPSTTQLKESEKAYTVHQRMERMAGLVKEEKKTETFLDKLKKLDENPRLELPEEKKPTDLVDNFNWHIARARRNRGLSQRQLGWALGESEAAIKMIERGELPEDSEKFIRKLEQFLQIILRKRTEENIEIEKRQKERTQEKFKERFLEERQEKIPEEDIEIEELIEEKAKEATSLNKQDELELINSIAGGKVAGRDLDETKSEEITPLKELSFNPESARKLTISDLRTLREKRIKEAKERKNSLRDIREKVGDEMKDLALGKTTKTEKTSANKNLQDKKIPTIYELMERKKARYKEEEMVGDEIEIEE